MNFAEVIYELVGAVDGVNRTYTVPTQFELGSFRPIVNGIVYSESDEQWGVDELNVTTVRFFIAPKVGFVLQGFYREPVAIGSPFSGGSIP